MQILTTYFGGLTDEAEIVGSTYQHNLLMKHFGSVQDAMVSLLQATTGGIDWAVLYS